MKLSLNSIKLLVLLVCTLFFVSGCDKYNSSDDIIKIVPPSAHEVIKDRFAYDKGALLNQGIINLRAGNTDKSIEILERFTKYYPGNSVGQFYLGKAYYNKAMYDEAISRFQMSINLDRSDAGAFLYLAKVYKKKKLTKKAIKILYIYLVNTSDPADAEKIKQEINLLAKPAIGKNIIGRVFETNEVIKGKNLALKSKACFDTNVPEIYTSLEIIEAPSNTKIEVQWYYISLNEKKIKVNSTSFRVNGTGNSLVSLKKPASGWPKGEYKLEIFVDGENNTDLNFYIF